jgi:hypothetical protein
MAAHLKIGIDYGGVLCSTGSYIETDDTEYNTEINIEGALLALTDLKLQGHDLYLISFCGRHRAEETRHIINTRYPNLFTELYFVTKKSNKAGIIDYLGCDVMIDDRIEILQNIHRHIPSTQCIWFIGDPAFERDQTYTQDFALTITKSWSEVTTCISKLTPTARAMNTEINITKLLNSRTYKYA